MNSIDTDGVKGGFGLEMLESIINAVNLPVVASGGAGKAEHFTDLFKRVNADAGLGASVFHYNEIKINDLKRQLKDSGICVRV